MARFELLVGSAAFWDRARMDVAAARGRVLVQAMTFEGDAAGQGVAAAINAATATDRRVLVDDYTRHVINDTFLAGSRDPALMAEARATWAMFDALILAGAGVRVTNPVGRNPLRYVARNHKKLLVMDDVAWIGGINFSDHNFAWHDMMIRIEDKAVADWLAARFEDDWHGRTARAREDFGPDLSLLSLDGSANPAQSDELIALIEGAQATIELLSAYPTMPFTRAMAQAAARGVAVTIHTPRPNNKPVVRDYLLGLAGRSGISLSLIDRMTHAKALLIDGKVLLAGSSNFDFVAHRLNAEHVAIIRDPGLIAQVEAQLFAPARAEGTAPLPADMTGAAPVKARLALNAANMALRLVRPGARVAEWERPG